MAGETKAEVDGAVGRRRFIVKANWTSLIAVCVGTLILVPLIANEISHLVRASFRPLPQHSILDDVVMGALWLWFASTVRARRVRFGIGLLAVALIGERVSSLLVHTTSVALGAGSSMMQLAGFILIEIAGIDWIRKQVRFA